MSSEDRFSLSLADRLCETVIAHYPQFGCVADENLDIDLAGGLPVKVLDGTHADRALRVFHARELAFEKTLLERRQVCESPASYGFVFQSDRDGNITCVTDTVIQNGEPTIFIPFDAPSVRGLVPPCIERPVCDAVRIFSYLVRVECELVGPLSNMVCLRSETVACVRETVRLLRCFIRRARLTQCEDADDDADKAENTADDLRSVHAADSTGAHHG